MSRLTLRLPETLHQQLSNLAQGEGISLNQYVVYALTKQVTLAYSVQELSEEVISQQKHSFASQLQKLGKASSNEIEAVLAERQKVEPEEGLTPEIINRFQQQIRSKNK